MHFLLKTNILKIKIITFICFISIGLSQEISYKVDYFSNPLEKHYWWATKNNDGKYIKKNILDFEWTLNNSNTNYKIVFSNAFSQKKSFKIGESFIQHNLSKNIVFKTGKYYREFSTYLNDNLSSGSMLISNNAQPMPKVGLFGLARTKKDNNIYFDWGIAHGWFKKNQYYTDAPYLHEKFLYLNIIKHTHKLSIGFVHEAIWAGSTVNTVSNNSPGNQPDTFKDFLKVFIAADGPLLQGEKHANALGSHMGIWDFAYTRKNNEKILTLYYQHYFEDTSSLRFQNKTDGLWGLELQNYIPKTKLLIEYLDTSHCCINPPYQNDIYYWNYQYNDGWKYKDMVVGNPFVNSSQFIELTKLAHIGLSSTVGMNTISIKASKKINVNDIIHYKLSFNRRINNTKIYLMIFGNEYNNTLGFGLSHLIKK